MMIAETAKPFELSHTLSMPENSKYHCETHPGLPDSSERIVIPINLRHYLYSELTISESS